LHCLFALVLAATPAAADPGVHLSWDHCSADGRVANRNFACNTNGGSAVIVLSYESPLLRTDRVGAEIVLEVFASDPVALPAWWQFKNAGSCRASSMSVNLVAAVLPTACDYPWTTGSAAGVGAYQVGKWGPNTAHLLIAEAVPFPNTFTVGPGIETFALNVVIDHAKTVGTGACAGCTQPVCIGVGAVTVQSANSSDDILMDASSGPALKTVTWQGAYVSQFAYVGGTFTGSANLQCAASAPVAARQRTWGQLRSLYR
jgi:hypothetical protein